MQCVSSNALSSKWFADDRSVSSCDLTSPTDALAAYRRGVLRFTPKLKLAGNTVSLFQKPFALTGNTEGVLT